MCFELAGLAWAAALQEGNESVNKTRFVKLAAAGRSFLNGRREQEFKPPSLCSGQGW